MTYIGSATAYSAVAVDVLDASTSLDIQADDVLVCYLAGNIGRDASAISDIDGTTNAFTITTPRTTSFWSVQGAYVVAASADNGSTIRVNLGTASNGEWGFIVTQLRPSAGETITFNSGPAGAQSAYGSNPTSANLSTTSTDSLFVGGASNDRAILSGDLIGGAAADGTNSLSMPASFPNGDFHVSYSVFNTAQTDINYATSSSSGVWGAQLIGFDISTSGGTTYNESVTESMTLAETQDVTASFDISLIESIALNDTQTALIDYLASISESMTLDDAVSDGGMTYNVSVTEGIALNDVLSAVQTISGDVIESITINDSQSVTGTYNVSMSESIALSEAFSSGDVAVGRVCMTISGKSATIEITANKPTITITGEGCT